MFPNHPGYLLRSALKKANGDIDSAITILLDNPVEISEKIPRENRNRNSQENSEKFSKENRNRNSRSKAPHGRGQSNSRHHENHPRNTPNQHTRTFPNNVPNTRSTVIDLSGSLPQTQQRKVESEE